MESVPQTASYHPPASKAATPARPMEDLIYQIVTVAAILLV
jgi:hypothetical protein